MSEWVIEMRIPDKTDWSGISVYPDYSAAMAAAEVIEVQVHKGGPDFSTAEFRVCEIYAKEVNDE